MALSYSGVLTIGVIVGLSISYMLGIKVYRYLVRSYATSGLPRGSSIFARAFIALAMLLYSALLYHIGFLDKISFPILIIGALFLYFFFKEKSAKYFESYFERTTDSEEYASKTEKKILNYVSFSLIIFLPYFCQGTNALLLFLLPDTTIIETTNGIKSHSVVYGWQFGKGSKNLGGSYVCNDTPDTIFQVNVRYAMFGKDDCNFFAVNDTIPPLSTIKTERKPEYILVRIPSIMNSVASRRGSYNRVVSFIASKRQLENFSHRAMGRFALFPNTLTKAAGLPDRSGVTKLDDPLYKYENEITATLAAKGFNPPPSLSKNDRLPFFKQGKDSLNRYIEEHLRYPEFCKVAGIEGKVIVCLSISDKGVITDAKAVGSADPFLDSEAERVAKSLPPWEPGILNGKPAPAKISIPIEFSLPAQ